MQRQSRAPKDSEQTRTQSRADTEPVVVPISPRNELLALQIQAFLHASQDEELDGDVEIDEEIVKDILDVLSNPWLQCGEDEQPEENNYHSDSSDSDFCYKGRLGPQEVLLKGQIEFIFRLQIVNVKIISRNSLALGKA